MSSPSDQRVTLDDLLRLKRSERPRPEFWTQFESELRAKQLAAIIERPPVWARCGGWMRSLLRHPVPLGAAGAVVVGIASLHEFGYAAIFRAHRSVVAPVAAAAAPAHFISPASPMRVASLAVERHPAAVHAPLRRADRSIAADDTAVEVDALRALTGEAAVPRPQETGWGRGLFAGDSGWTEVAAATSTAATLEEPAAMREPLTHLTATANDVRARLLDDDLPSASPASSPVLSEHTVSHLSDDRLYESEQRFGVGGDHLLIKF